MFRDHFEDLLTHRPTGRPDFDGYRDMIRQKYKEVKEGLKLSTHGHKYKEAYKQVS